MFWTIIILLIILALVAYAALRKPARNEPPPESFVCDICGQDECICHKEHVDTQA
ncbi:MAG: hypothetical protein ABII06_05020 [Pseudomonadota bacterium]